MSDRSTGVGHMEISLRGFLSFGEETALAPKYPNTVRQFQQVTSK